MQPVFSSRVTYTFNGFPAIHLRSTITFQVGGEICLGITYFDIHFDPETTYQPYKVHVCPVCGR
jgi:hypothetical protein